MSNSMIEVADLEVTYQSREKPCLRDIGLVVEPGESVLLTGGSGSGKSTLLRCFNALIPHLHPASIKGKVRVAGLEPAAEGLAAVGRRVSSVLQNPRTQFFCSDPRSEMAFASENYGRPVKEIRERIAAAERALSLKPLMGTSMHHMSGGQRQRIAVGAAHVNRPQLYLLDEPTSGLDRDSIDKLNDMIGTLREEGATILVADHRLAWLAGRVDRVLMLKRGCLTEEWSADDFFALDEDSRLRLGLRRLHRTASPGLPSAPDEADGLRLENIRFSYRRGTPVLDIPHAVLPRGAITVVSGPNGAGKSTLARALTGLIKPRGDMVMDGTKLSAKTRRHRCFLVMQDVNLQLFADSVREEISSGKTAQEPTDLLERMRLSGLEERHPLSLSGGQQQRTVVAAALNQRRDIYVFDEPSSGLDHASMLATADQLRSLADSGAVVVLITHDDELVAACGDHELRLS